MTKLCIKILVKLTLRFNQRFLSPWGVLPFACMGKRGRVLWVQRGGAAHFVILSGEKRRMLAYLKQEN